MAHRVPFGDSRGGGDHSVLSVALQEKEVAVKTDEQMDFLINGIKKGTDK